MTLTQVISRQEGTVCSIKDSSQDINIQELSWMHICICGWKSFWVHSDTIIMKDKCYHTKKKSDTINMFSLILYITIANIHNGTHKRICPILHI